VLMAPLGHQPCARAEHRHADRVRLLQQLHVRCLRYHHHRAIRQHVLASHAATSRKSAGAHSHSQNSALPPTQQVHWLDTALNKVGACENYMNIKRIRGCQAGETATRARYH